MNQPTPFRAPYVFPVPPAPKGASLISRIVHNITNFTKGLLHMFVALVKIGLVVSITAATVAAWAVLFAFPVKWLWNYVVPYLFRGVPELDFWHALALLTLCGLLFKSSSPSSSDSK